MQSYFYIKLFASRIKGQGNYKNQCNIIADYTE